MGQEDDRLDDLLRIVGKDRANHAPEEVEAAERRLKELSASSLDRTAAGMKKAGGVAAAIGLFIGITSLFVLYTIIVVEGKDILSPAEGGPGLLFIITWLSALCCQLVGAWVLFFAGLAFRRQKEWARKTLVVIMWIVIIYAAGFGVFWVMTAAFFGGPLERIAPMIAIGALMTGFLTVMFIKAQRYFSSRDVKEACRKSILPARKKTVWKVLLPLCIAGFMFFGVALPYAFWRSLSEQELNSRIKSLKRSGAILDIARFKPPLPPEDQNGAALFKKAFALMEEAEAQIEPAKLPKPEMQANKELESWEELLALETWTGWQSEYASRVLDYYAGAVAVLRKAAEKPHVNFNWDYAQGYNMRYPEVYELGRALRVILLSARVNHARGRDDQMMADFSVALKIAAALKDDPILLYVRISSLNSVLYAIKSAIHKDGASPTICAGLDRQLCKAKDAWNVKRSIEYERALSIWFCKAIRSGDWELVNRTRPSAWKVWLLRASMNRRMVRVVDLWSETLSASEGPMNEAIGELAELEAEIAGESYRQRKWSKIAPGLLQSVGCPGAEIRQYAKSLAGIDSLRIALAMHRFKSERGRQPYSVGELVPEFLPELPRDPFTGSDFRVIAEKDAIMVYSVGPNLKDERGKHWKHEAKPHDWQDDIATTMPW